LTKRLEELRREKRAYVVLDLPTLTLADRCKLALHARSYVGRFYDVGQALLYTVNRRFESDGTGTMVCSRLVTAAYYSGLGLDLFPVEKRAEAPRTRRANLAKGYATPADLLRSNLEVVRFVASPTATSPEDLL
jgi:hypothetical protein